MPAEYAEQVLERMRRVRIRNKPVTVKMATPRGYKPGPRRERPRTGVWRPEGKRGSPNRRHAA